MSRADKIKLTLSVTLVTIGVLAAGLPKQWIEEAFGFEPDGGNGALELVIAAVPLVLGVLLAVSVVRSRRAETHGASPAGASQHPWQSDG
jgi:hypothetical protein